MKTTRVLSIVILLVVSLGCASGPAAPPTVDVTGRWTGAWRGTVGMGDAWATLQQSGATVTGDLRLTGTPDLNPGGPVEGTVEGDVLTFIWANRNGRARGEFTVKGEQMSGTTQLLARLQWNLTRAQ